MSADYEMMQYILYTVLVGTRHRGLQDKKDFFRRSPLGSLELERLVQKVLQWWLHPPYHYSYIVAEMCKAFGMTVWGLTRTEPTTACPHVDHHR